MKRKNSHTKTKTSNRVPPSVPKCVKKSADGYVTGFVQSPDHAKTVKFMFRKTNLGYSVFRIASDSTTWVDMSNDISIAPSTRQQFSNLTTLKTAIAATETWLGTSLPEIR